MIVVKAICVNPDCKTHFTGPAEPPKFCGKCGSEIINKCPKCKKLIAEMKETFPKFCEACGESLKKPMEL
jgi:hypothetical protein